MVACKFHSFAIFTTLEYELGDVGTLLSAITGWRFNDDILQEIGERIYAIERVFNVRAGVGPEFDSLPKGLGVDLKGLLREYYEERGWRNGVPRL